MWGDPHQPVRELQDEEAKRLLGEKTLVGRKMPAGNFTSTDSATAQAAPAGLGVGAQEELVLPLWPQGHRNGVPGPSPGQAGLLTANHLLT